ncbi:MAG: endonuclease/exonuclease/phosphatase family protein [bacterium]
MLSLLSYNIRMGKKLGAILDWLASDVENKKLDIICFQEFPQSKVEFYANFFDKDHYDFSFSHSFKKRSNCYGQLTLINRNKLKIIDSRVVTLGLSQIESLVFKNKGERSGLIMKVEYKGKIFKLVNTHLTALALNKRRLGQLARIIEDLDPAFPALLLGDLNYASLINKKTLLEFMASHRFENATQRMKTHRLLLIRQQIDFIFHRDCQVREVRVKKVDFSDHYPIFAKISFLSNN